MQNPEEYMLPCLNKKLFGVECFGCGLQRSVVLIFKGEFVEAFYMYPAIYTLLPLFFIVVFNIFFKFKNANRIKAVLAIVSIVIIIVSYLIKIIK
ncbi:DUF2752 domain-containing protein [Seonamhaeicola marinus]|uniref:DUF2752 domain-containing protein n=1 Tax=Seonamhaeicola marinus TaxID=1912246 RepID=A0A5D0HJW0_9FLAO|nr:DUF2752 domain-containing protein [Seonamhaeicola marinus]TYA71673.1 DUF2752 domain-containing protein [Seonamhaeicola marinus]